MDEAEWLVKGKNAMEIETGGQGRHRSPLEANMRFPVICKRKDTSYWVLLLALKQNLMMLAFVSLFTTFQNNGVATTPQ